MHLPLTSPFEKFCDNTMVIGRLAGSKARVDLITSLQNVFNAYEFCQLK